MNKEEAYARLRKIFVDVLDDDTIELNDNTTASDIDGWDSFEHINIIAAIENEFSFKVPVSKIITMKNVGEMVDLILKMGK